MSYEQDLSNVAQSLGSVVKILDDNNYGLHVINSQIKHLDHQIADITKATAILAKQSLKMSKRGIILPVAVGVIIGVNLHKKLQERGLSDRLRDFDAKLDAVTEKLKDKDTAKTEPKITVNTTPPFSAGS